MATIKDVAQSAQVSATTVSRVLNRDDNMSVTPEVRMRIFQAAHALGALVLTVTGKAQHQGGGGTVFVFQDQGAAAHPGAPHRQPALQAFQEAPGSK